ncbi:hypothetical protein KC368_g24 [Hortaea werneckii]|nr:hypothetical protein KC368_g24 [Hortaea werneckii]
MKRIPSISSFYNACSKSDADCMGLGTADSQILLGSTAHPACRSLSSLQEVMLCGSLASLGCRKLAVAMLGLMALRTDVTGILESYIAPPVVTSTDFPAAVSSFAVGAQSNP